MKTVSVSMSVRASLVGLANCALYLRYIGTAPRSKSDLVGQVVEIMAALAQKHVPGARCVETAEQAYHVLQEMGLDTMSSERIKRQTLAALQQQALGEDFGVSSLARAATKKMLAAPAPVAEPEPEPAETQVIEAQERTRQEIKAMKAALQMSGRLVPHDSGDNGA